MAQIESKLSESKEKTLALRELDVSELRSLISRTAGNSFELFTDLKKDHPKIVQALQARGASAEQAEKEASINALSLISSYPPTDRASTCTVVFPKALPLGSVAEKLRSFQLLYADDEKGRLITKYAAYHEGAHCGQMELLRELGMTTPKTKFGEALSTAVAEAYSDSLATLCYLQDAAKLNKAEQEKARIALSEFTELKHDNAPLINSLSSKLVTDLLGLPVKQIEIMTDKEMRDFVRKLIIENAQTFMEWLKDATTDSVF